MKTTLEIPDALYRRVKSKSSLDGRPVRSVTQRLYELWLDGTVSIDDATDACTTDNRTWEQTWLRETETLADRIDKQSVDKRLARDILKDDRR